MLYKIECDVENCSFYDSTMIQNYAKGEPKYKHAWAFDDAEMLNFPATKTNNEPEFWGMEGDEYITWTSIEDRVSDYLELYLLDEVEPEKTLKLVGYVKATPHAEDFAQYILRTTIEWLDEEYTIENVSNEDLIKAHHLIEAAKDFLEKILKDYKVEILTRVCERVVNIEDYI